MRSAIGALTPSPAILGYFVRLDPSIQLSNIYFAGDWLYLPAIARELTSILFTASSGEIPVVDPKRRPRNSDRARVCAHLQNGLLNEWLGVQDRSGQSESEDGDEVDRFLAAKSLDLWRASGRDSLVFMRRSFAMQKFVDGFFEGQDVGYVQEIKPLGGLEVEPVDAPVACIDEPATVPRSSLSTDTSSAPEFKPAGWEQDKPISLIVANRDIGKVDISRKSEVVSVSRLEASLSQFISVVLGLPEIHDRVQGMGRRFGLDGVKPWSLDMVGAELGLTRERVRQIERKIRGSEADRSRFSESFRQVSSLIELIIPCSVVELNSAMSAGGLTSQHWSWLSLTAVAEFAGKTLSCTEIDGFLCEPNDLWIFKEARSLVKKLSDRNGATSLDLIIDRFDSECVVDRVALQSYLGCLESVFQLDEGWIWVEHKDGRNRLVNTSKRILAVTQPQSLASMYDGVERNVSWRNSTAGAFRELPLYMLPLEILEKFYRSHPDFSIDESGNVRSREAISIDILGPEKMVLVGILESSPYKALPRNELIRRCHEEGMNPSTVQVFLTYAECIWSPGVNIWGLRGVSVDESVVLQLQSDATSLTRSFDSRRCVGSWSNDKIWFYQRISPSVMYTGVVSIKWPSDTDDTVRLQIIDGVDGQPSGMLGRSGGFVYGFLAVLRKNSAISGDVLRVQLIISEGIAIAEVGGDELLEEPFDWSSLQM
ncbi:hypothetical protein HQO84_14415 [Rhodococcus fascians]|nr:hypothetical protein [Rhodococcus fascians]MBY3996312.1 hypothetical protein [Rhodococcus fascians]MBY4002973.1 hypothetical protein [Rhodococcus fascians]MBY4007723.1 hypothetical protein [Rhodococcus fascians]MBY4017524.1 hypothetical protein [Rhodococcus fascians]